MNIDLHKLAEVLHKAKMKECLFPNQYSRQPFPQKKNEQLGGFGYLPQPWTDLAYAQAKAVIKHLNEISQQQDVEHLDVVLDATEGGDKAVTGGESAAIAHNLTHGATQ